MREVAEVILDTSVTELNVRLDIIRYHPHGVVEALNNNI